MTYRIRDMTAALSIEEYQQRVSQILATTQLPVETIPLIKTGRSAEVGGSAGVGDRLLAGEIRAQYSQPLWDNSQMDGFAVRAAETPACLPVAGTVAAGHTPAPLPPGTCVRIMTGAPLPEGADAVVPVENTPEASFTSETVTLPRVVPGEFVRQAGTDIQAGHILLSDGTRLTPVRLGALTAQGITTVTVRARPQVAIITSGDEIQTPGKALEPGQVYDTNRIILYHFFHSLGAEIRAHYQVSDDPDTLGTLLNERIAPLRPDVIISSGGISAGAFEVVKDTFASAADSAMTFGSIAMQPGGPQGYGMYAGIPVICMPGNPVSTWVTCEVILRAACATAWGTPAPHWEVAYLAEAVEPLRHKERILRGQLHKGGKTTDEQLSGELRGVIPFTGTGSHLLAQAAMADAVIRIPASSAASMPAGTPVKVHHV